MKKFFILFFLFIFSTQSSAWWTQKPLPKNLIQFESNPQNRVQFTLRKIHLYQQKSGEQKLIQTGSAFVLDQRHLLTSLYNVSRLGRFPDHVLYLEQDAQTSPLQVKYLDYYNGVALLYSSSILTDLPLLTDFDLNPVSTNESLQLLNIDKKEIKNIPAHTFGRWHQRTFSNHFSPSASYSLAGNPILNSQNKIAGIYLGKIQGTDLEYYLPTAKLSHLLEKAKLTANTAPDFASPQRQFQNQIKAFQEKIVQSLLTEPVKHSTSSIFNWQIQKIPSLLNCVEQKNKPFPV